MSRPATFGVHKLRWTLTINDVAEWLGLHRNSVAKMIADGELPAVKIGQNWMMDPADVIAAIEATSNVRPDGAS